MFKAFIKEKEMQGGLELSLQEHTYNLEAKMGDVQYSHYISLVLPSF